LDDIMQIEQASFSMQWTRKMFRDELEGNPFASLFVGREAGTIISHMCYWLIFEELHIMTIAVSPHYRRHGVASAMMTHAITHARTQDAHSAMLEVRASNVPAIAFYTHIGFQQIACRGQYYSNPVEDAMIMRRMLLDTGDATQTTSTQEALHTMKAVSG